jgi:hypothetical protein
MVGGNSHLTSAPKLIVPGVPIGTEALPFGNFAESLHQLEAHQSDIEPSPLTPRPYGALTIAGANSRHDLLLTAAKSFGVDPSDELALAAFLDLLVGAAEALGVDPSEELGFAALLKLYEDREAARSELNTRRDKEGFAPLHRAVIQGNCQVVTLFLDLGADLTEIVSAAVHHQVRAREIGGGHRKLPSLESSHVGRHCMTLAAACGADRSVIKLLVDKSAELIVLMDERGETPLTTAIKCGFENCVDWLIGIDPFGDTKRNAYGEIPLVLAVAHGQWRALSHLLGRTYPRILHVFQFEDTRGAGLQDISEAVTLLATKWRELPHREKLLYYFVTPLEGCGPCVVFPAEHCIDSLFAQGMKLIAEVDDYSLIEALIKWRAHKHFADEGRKLIGWASEQGYQRVIDLCTST